MKENMNSGCPQKDSAEHEGYAKAKKFAEYFTCLLYTSDAADE